MTARSAAFVLTPYCPDSIGEQAVQVPFFRFLRETRPDVEIVAVAPERSAATIERLGLADRHVSYPVRAGVSRLRAVARQLRPIPCERVFLPRRKSWRAALLARFATRAPIHGFAHGLNGLFQASSIPYDHTVYIAENYTRLLGRTVAEFADAFRVPREDYALIIPGGLTEIKRYPLVQYLTVARALARERPVHFLLGPDSETERELLCKTEARYRIHFAPPLDEVETVVRKASLVVANDCGPGHFAHIYDVPRISLFDRSVDSAPWFFAGKNGRLLQSSAPGEIAGIATERILELAQELSTRSRH